MASTTCGWQCPVEVTAMPAEKSKNSFPSTSVTTMPRPCFATRGYERVYEGEMYLSSPSRICLALGPGNLVLILGPTARVLVDMGSSEKTVVSSRLLVLGCGRIGELVAAEEVGAGLCGQRIRNLDHICIIAG